MTAQVTSVSTHIHSKITTSGLTTQYLAVFGSVLNPKRFDLQGPGTSDLDVIGVVKEDFKAYEIDLGFRNRYWISQPVGSGVFQHYSDFLSIRWDGGRNVDLFLISGNVFDQITEDLRDGNIAGTVEAMKSQRGQGIYLLALAEGQPLFQNLDLQRMALLDKLHSLHLPEIDVEVQRKRRERGNERF